MLQNLIDDLMDFESINKGKLRLNVTKFNLKECI